MRHKREIITTILIALQLCARLCAIPTTAEEAELAVSGWLKVNPQPLGMTIGRDIAGIETFTNDEGKPVYYVVYLSPSGFVIVSADDLVEPIVGFAGDGTYDPSLDNPLGALVTKDLNSRIKSVQSPYKLQGIAKEAPLSNTQKKWSQLVSIAAESDSGFTLFGLGSVSDVWVAPLVQSTWDQEYVCGKLCYNMYTPNYYPSGCVATAMAQLMRFHQYPLEPDDSISNSLFGRRSFTVTVDGEERTMYLMGGDGSGGPYRWHLMALAPNCSTTLPEREAIGALCYDAGISVNMSYETGGSEAYLYTAKQAMLTTFQYENAIDGLNYDYDTSTFHNIGSGLIGMVNPNLDAGHPVILGLTGSKGGHAILADGYGYNFSTLFHHLNMGWSRNFDAYYNLPTINSNPSFNVVDECVYNIFTSGKGEIISGRVTDVYGHPIRGATVTAADSTSLLTNSHSAETNDKGIYALKGLASNKRFIVSANKTGYNFDAKYVTTGESKDGRNVSGNKWEINFQDNSESPVIVREYVYTYVPQDIPDNDWIFFDLNISDSGTIVDLDVKLNVDHERCADLVVSLLGPDASIVLSDKDSRSWTDGFETTFDDEAPVNGYKHRQPAGSLSDFDGGRINGNWRLRIWDQWDEDIGTLRSWSLVAKLKQ